MNAFIAFSPGPKPGGQDAQLPLVPSSTASCGVAAVVAGATPALRVLPDMRGRVVQVQPCAQSWAQSGTWCCVVMLLWCARTCTQRTYTLHNTPAQVKKPAEVSGKFKAILAQHADTFAIKGDNVGLVKK